MIRRSKILYPEDTEIKSKTARIISNNYSELTVTVGSSMYCSSDMEKIIIREKLQYFFITRTFLRYGPILYPISISTADEDTAFSYVFRLGIENFLRETQNDKARRRFVRILMGESAFDELETDGEAKYLADDFHDSPPGDGEYLNINASPCLYENRNQIWSLNHFDSFINDQMYKLKFYPSIVAKGVVEREMVGGNLFDWYHPLFCQYFEENGLDNLTFQSSREGAFERKDLSRLSIPIKIPYTMKLNYEGALPVLEYDSAILSLISIFEEYSIDECYLEYILHQGQYRVKISHISSPLMNFSTWKAKLADLKFALENTLLMWKLLPDATEVKIAVDADKNLLIGLKKSNGQYVKYHADMVLASVLTQTLAQI